MRAGLARPVLILAWVILFALPPASRQPAHASAQSRSRAAGSSTTTSLADAQTLLALASSALPRVHFVTGPGGSILVHATYPKVDSPCVDPIQPLLHARYSGQIEVGKDTDGRLFIIGTMSVEDYLRGIAEVPRTWPMAALKAQVVAARSYALAHMSSSDPTAQRLGYQLCATDACQVYRGLGIADGPYGDRWRKAVNATDGQALLYGGRPADTLYFSTSNGSTVGNDQVFGSSPLPYLRPVPERDDGASPVSHWTASIRLGDVARFLRQAGDWGSGTVTSVATSGSNVVVKGPGQSDTLSVTTFRSDMNAWAHCLDPSRYPTVDRDGTLPQTVPSIWFHAKTSAGSAVLTGRGWGHGVGMVQWGAEGKAARGLSYGDILAYYYGGLRPRHYDEPAAIRIGIAVGLKTVTVVPTGPVTALDVPVSTVGPWLVRGGKRLRVSTGHEPPAYITSGTLKGPKRAAMGHTLSATLTLPQTSVVNLVLAPEGGGSEVQVTKPTTELPGTVELSGTLPELVTGQYSLQAVVTNGVDIVRTPARSIRVKGVPPSPSPSPSPSPTPTTPAAVLPSRSPTSGGTPLGWIVGLALLPVAVGGALLALRLRRTRRAATPPPASG